MKTKLYPTQLEDVERHAGGVDIPNWSEAGTGKTNTALGVVEALGMNGGVVLCPTVATLMWKRKIEQELGAKAQWLQTKAQKIDKTADFYVLSYGVLDGHLDSLLVGDHDMLIIDEAHRLKNLDSKRTKMVFGESGDGEGGLYETSRYCLQLTGTPIERYADDLWAQLRACQPEWLQRYNALELRQFQTQFCRMEEKSYNNSRPKLVSVGSQNEKLLNRMIKDIGVVRRSILDVSKYMPPVSYREVYAKSKPNAELRDAMRGLSDAMIEERLQGDVGSTMHRLLGLSKLEGIIEYLVDEAEKAPLLVGYWHKAVGDALMEAMPGKVPALRIGGDTAPMVRERIKDRFIAGEIRVLFGQIAAMGEALDGLQHVCNRVVMAEDHWSGAKVEQFIKRVYRNGQEKPVLVDFVKADHPVDDALTRVRERKAAGYVEILD